MKILFYGPLGEALGRETEVEPPSGGCTVAELRQLLASLHPHAAHHLTRPAVRACVADRLVGEDFPLRGAEAVEFLPPLSGG